MLRPRYAIFAIREEAVQTIHEQTGLYVDGDSGAEEAELSYYGAANAANLSDGVLFEHWGGSTELVNFFWRNHSRIPQFRDWLSELVPQECGKALASKGRNAENCPSGSSGPFQCADAQSDALRLRCWRNGPGLAEHGE